MHTVALAVPTRPVQAKIGNVSEKDEELAIAQKKLADMKKEVSLKTKELQDRGNGLETIDKKSMDLEVKAALHSLPGSGQVSDAA